MLVAIGGMIAVMVLKLLEDAHREMRGEVDLNEADKQPQEHDERFCWEVSALVHMFLQEKYQVNCLFQKFWFPSEISQEFIYVDMKTERAILTAMLRFPYFWFFFSFMWKRSLSFDISFIFRYGLFW